MSETYSESLLLLSNSPQYIEFLAEQETLPDFFHFPLAGILRRGKLENSFDLNVYWFSGSNGDPKTAEEKNLGSLVNLRLGSIISSHFGVTIVLNERQKVFSPLWLGYGRLDGPTVHENRFVGKFKPALAGGKELDVILTLHPDSVVIDGVLNGQIQLGVFYWN